MYSKRSGLIIGFHGCDLSVAQDVVSGVDIALKPSENIYDWLGHGVYFWENNYERAMQYAVESQQRKNSKIKTPAVLGAIIDLGYCFDLLDSEFLITLESGYKLLEESHKKHSQIIPENKSVGGSQDLLLRDLDCAVIESVHQLNKDNDLDGFDSVRGVFFEGDNLYKNAGFKKKNHIQIAVRNPNCIKGYFLPRELDKSYPKP